MESEHILPDRLVHWVNLNGRIDTKADKDPLHPNDTTNDDDGTVKITEEGKEEEVA